MKDLIYEALDTAQRLGAEYADVRGTRFRKQRLAAHDLRPHEIRDQEEFGFGMRVLCDGAWGFASSSVLTLEEARRVAAEAVGIAKASARVRGDYRVALAEEPIHVDVFRTPVKIDPFSVSLEEKLGLLLSVNETISGAPSTASRTRGSGGPTGSSLAARASRRSGPR